MKIITKELIMNTPTPTPQCHASTIEILSDGTIVSAWFGGEKEGAPDVSIWVSRKEKGAWSKPVSVSAEHGIPHFNPVLFSKDGKSLTLFYKVGFKISEWKTMITESADGGKTWSIPRELVSGDESGGRGPVKNKPIIVSNGTILAPASTENGPWRCFIDVLAADGVWHKKHIPVNGNMSGLNVIQPTLWEQPEGHIHALMRSNMAYICESHSDDYGETWSETVLTDVPNNNSGIDCVLTEKGSIVLVCNPVAQHAGARTPLSIYLSEDNGETFKKIIDLETEPGEYSYPAIVSKENKVYITYTYRRENIMFCEFEI